MRALPFTVLPALRASGMAVGRVTSGGASSFCFDCSNTCSFFCFGFFFETAQLHCRRFNASRAAVIGLTIGGVFCILFNI